MASDMGPSNEFEDKQRRSLFGSSAVAYSDGRPGYPGEVFEYLSSSCGLGRGCRVLEIGPGTGQATGPLLDAGADVVAVEVGVDLSQLLESTYEDRQLELIVGEFESVELPSDPFDLVVAATSFHWVPPGAGLARVASMLRPGGFVALWWSHFGDSDREDPFREAVQPLLLRHAPQLAEGSERGGAGVGAHPYALDFETRTHEFDASGAFGPLEQFVIPWTATLTSVELRQFFNSFSNWMSLEDVVRNRLLDDIEEMVADDFGGVVQRPYLTAIYSAQRR